MFTQLLNNVKLLRQANQQEADSSTILPSIEIEEIDLRNITLPYSQLALKQYLNADLKQVYIDINEIDFSKNLIDINTYRA
jgi:hypothetical protein